MEQEVTRDSVTGRYEKQENKGPEDYETTEEHLSPWMKEWRRLGTELEAVSKSAKNIGEMQGIDTLAVLAVLHTRILKRP